MTACWKRQKEAKKRDLLKLVKKGNRWKFYKRKKKNRNNRKGTIYSWKEEQNTAKLQKFRGDPLDWNRFCEQFEPEINSMTKPVVTKFSHLHELLGLPYTKEGCKKAKEVLKTKYGITSEIIQDHGKQIMNLHVIISVDLKQIHEFYRLLNAPVVLQLFFLLMQGLEGSSTQQLPPPLPLLRIFPFQPALSHIPFHHLAPCPLSPSTSNDLIFFTQSSSSFCSACPRHWLNTHSFPQQYTAHPSHHPHLHTFQSTTLLCHYGSCLTSIYHGTPHTHHIQLPLQFKWHFLPCQDLWQLLKHPPHAMHPLPWMQNSLLHPQ